jgi:DNA invertase Pin-like site-specific DNA recombinase
MLGSAAISEANQILGKANKIFTDKVTGKLAARPELDKALAYLRKGDVFVITRLSRAMRSPKHLLVLADELRACGVGLVVLKQQIDTTTPTGCLVFHILGAIDEFQRELIVEGTREGLDAARARGRSGGRPCRRCRRRARRRRRSRRSRGRLLRPAEHPEIQQVEQRACHRAGIPPANRAPGEDIAARVISAPETCRQANHLAA